MTRPRRPVPLDLAVLGRTPDGSYIVRDCRTGDTRTEREIGRELTAYERHVCEERPTP